MSRICPRPEIYSKPPREGVAFLADAPNSALSNSMAREPPLCRASGFVLSGYEEVLRGRTLNQIGCERDVKFVPKSACG